MTQKKGATTALRTVIAGIIFCVFLVVHLSGRSRNGVTLISEPLVHHHGVVFDAGSTGTRVHIFSFTEDNMLLEERFHAHDMALASVPPAECFAPLLTFVFEVVPVAKLESTHVVVGATAGLRKLGDKADSILEDTKEYITSQGLHASSIAMLTGENEGLYAWTTVNYLLGNFLPGAQTTTILDCGGGSFQVVSEAVEGEVGVGFSVFGRSYQMTTFSGMGYGMNEAVGKAGGCTDHFACVKEMGDVLDGMQYTVHPKSGSMYAFSYYFKLFGATTVPFTPAALQNIAAQQCGDSPNDCAKFTYLSLLPVRLGAASDTKINIAKKLQYRGKDVETAWPLGAYFSVGQ